MDLFDGHLALDRPLRAPIVVLGNFDGVHLGHQRLIARASEIRDRQGGEVVVYTFEPHPAKVLAPELAPRLITTRARKLELLAEAGVDVCILEPFTRELAGTAPEQFVQEILVRALGVRHVVVGYDFTYGAARRGTTASLRAAGAEHGFEVEIVDPVTVDGIVASSTKVRDFVKEGNLPGAHLLLARDFEAEGPVVRGAGRGRDLGIPTANIDPETELLPRAGIYAVRVTLPGEPEAGVLAGAASLGTNPTFAGDGRQTLEVHLLDFDGDLYGKRLRLAFVAWLRVERRFESIEALVAQIRQDIADAREILRGGGYSREQERK